MGRDLRHRRSRLHSNRDQRVSIAAANAAAVAGAKNGDIPASLAALWEALSIPPQPLLPRDQQFRLSAWGVPGLFRPRSDYFDLIHWTGLCDPAPHLDTLDHIIDWRRLLDYRALTNLHVVSAPHISMEGCVVFSAATLRQCHAVGESAMRCYLNDQGLIS